MLVCVWEGAGRWMSKSCRDVVCRGVEQAHEEAGMEERRLVPGTVVFVIKNIKFYVLYLSYSTIVQEKGVE